ncbi:MAG: MFS transporter [Alphaproteobacteria bacterium]|nr:MFS transporter [Alphaproteobacteria bacterium]
MADSPGPDPFAAPQAADAAPIGRNRQFRLLWTCMLVIGAGNSMLLAVAPPLVRELNLGDASVGWIFSLSALLWVLASPYWGRLSDGVGRKPTIAFGLFAYAVSMGAFGTAVMLGQSGVLSGAALFVSLLLARALFGAFGSASSPSAQAYIADRTTAFERTAQLAGLSSAFAVGQAFGPGICAWLTARFGAVFPIWMVGVLALCASLAILFFLPERTAPHSKRQRASFMDSLSLITDRRLSGYLIYGFALSIVAGVTVQVFGLFTMDRLGVSGAAGTQMISYGFMANALALLFTQLVVLPRLNMGPRSFMIWGAAISCAAVVLQIFAPNLEVLLASQALLGLGAGLARPGFTGGASVAVDPHEQGAAAGLVVAVNGAGFIFSPLVGGVVYEHFGMNAPLVIVAAVLTFMSAFAIMSRRLRNIVTAPPPVDPPPS